MKSHKNKSRVLRHRTTVRAKVAATIGNPDSVFANALMDINVYPFSVVRPMSYAKQKGTLKTFV